MPPKRSTRKKAAAPPPPPPLENCVIALSGTFPGLSQQAIRDKAVALGAQITSSVTSTATHLITTQHDFLRQTQKVKNAVALHIPIVSLDWLLDSEENNKREQEKTYDAAAAANGAAKQAQAQAQSQSQLQSQSRAQPQQPLAPAPPKASGRPKRGAAVAAIADSDEEEEAKPKAKRARKGANGTATKPAGKSAKTADEDDHAAANGDGMANGTVDVAGDNSKPAVAASVADTKGKDSRGKGSKAKSKDKKVDKEGVADGQTAKSKNLQVPLDEACLMSGYTVYIDDDDHIWDASLNQTNASNNNNKFYKIQVIRNSAGDFKTWTRWGRVGERGQIACLGNGTEQDAIKQFHKKFKDKSGHDWENRNEPTKPGKYTFIERSYNADSDEEGDDGAQADAADGKGKEKWVPPECTLAAPVQDLVKLIFNQQYFAAAMSELNYDANKLPLGKLSKTTISRGFQALKDLAALLDDNSLAQSQYGMTVANATEHLSNSYYSLIPHDFGRNRPPVICENSLLKKEIELLESLSDMKDASLIMKVEKSSEEVVHPLDKLYNGLNLNEMTAIDPAEDEFKLLKDYLNSTRGETHGHTYTVQEIFRIERSGEHERFDKQSPLAGPPRDRRLLWHGSRVTNFGGILSQGLRIAPPEAPVSGYMFGKGIYLADMSSKSANYCCSYISGGQALLLLCEAELGDPIQALTDADYDAGEKAKKQGMYSTWGQGQTGPKQWKDAECVHPSLKGVKMPDTSVKPGKTNVESTYLLYNEYIVYDVSQVRLRYLFRVKM